MLTKISKLDLAQAQVGCNEGVNSRGNGSERKGYWQGGTNAFGDTSALAGPQDVLGEDEVA